VKQERTENSGSRVLHCAKLNSFPDGVLSHHIGMKVKQLTPRQLSSVHCPTCGAAAGERYVLNSDTLRSGPHIDRKLLATEAVEKKRIQVGVL
jgi:hypothetical protein